MKHRITPYLFTVLTLASVNVLAQSEKNAALDSLSQQDKNFVQTASIAGNTEIDASKLALTKSSNADVKRFARRMIADHTKLAHAVQTAAPKGAMDAGDNADPGLMSQLNSADGKAFDTLYIQKVGLEGHKEALALFQGEASQGQDKHLKAVAQKNVKMIEMHDRLAKRLAKSANVSSS